ncbi:PIN domain-containing protein [Gulosibacter chungangensis]|uniref:PIN domain-containing protein n=1 Tax=Gulosibacter chungangensis TaxID=979746 RepID=UPI0017881914|nr:PIN domain-containing protein [Gulosibacter chungangensis]
MFSAFLDANVLVPVVTCDTLLRLADNGAFRPLWSPRVIDEAQTALERIHPNIDKSRFQSRFRSMNNAFEDASVEGWETIQQSVTLPDPDDRHVVAAAILGRADVIVTQNTKDFPDETLRMFGMTAVRLDDFLLDQFHFNPSRCLRVITEQTEAMTNPPVAIDELLERLSRSGAPEFAARVRAELSNG